MGGRIAQASEKDQQTFAKVELLAGSLACKNLSSEPKVPKTLDKYAEGMIFLNAKSCRSYSVRLLQHNAVVNPTRHFMKWIHTDFPLMRLVIEEAHRTLHGGQFSQ